MFRPAGSGLRLAHRRPGALRRQIEAGPTNIWRYAPLLPVPADIAEKPNLNPGCTKLIRADNLARELGVTATCTSRTTPATRRTPSRTASWPIALEAARNFGLTTLSCSSTGNLASAVGAAAARAGFRSCVFIPHDLEQGKVIMAAIYGGDLVASTATTTT